MTINEETEQKTQQTEEQGVALTENADTKAPSAFVDNAVQGEQPPQPTVQCTCKCCCMPRYGVVILLMLLLVMGAIEFGLHANSSADRSPAYDLPQGAAFYCELNEPWNDSAATALFNSKAYRWLCVSDDSDSIFAKFRATYSDFVNYRFNSTPGKLLKHLFGFEPSTYLGARVGIAIYSIKGKMPDIAVSAEMFLPIRVAGLERTMSFLPAGSTYKSSLAGDVTMPTKVFEATLPDGSRIYIFERRGRLVVATNYSRVEDMLSPTFKPLALQQDFASAVEWERTHDVSVRFSPSVFIDEIASALKEESGFARVWKYFNKLFGKIAFDSFAYSHIDVHCDLIRIGKRAGLRFSLDAPLDPEKSDLTRLEAAEIKDFDAAKHLPNDTFLTLCWSKDVPNLWQSILKEQTPDELEKIKADPASKVFEEEFFPAMGRVHTISLVPQTPDPRFQREFPFPSLVLCFGLKDVKTFSDIVYEQVDKFMEKLRLEHEESGEAMPFLDKRVNHKGIEINYFEIPNNPVKDAIVPCYAFLADNWIISTSIEGIRKCIDAVKDNKSLYNQGIFSELSRRSFPASGWIYTDPKSLAVEFNTNATAWNESLLKIAPEDIPLPELRYRPHEQAEYQNRVREEQLKRKKALDRLCSAMYNLAPLTAIYAERKERLVWSFEFTTE